VTRIAGVQESSDVEDRQVVETRRYGSINGAVVAIALSLTFR